jgi:hypothetical protein
VVSRCPAHHSLPFLVLLCVYICVCVCMCEGEKLYVIFLERCVGKRKGPYNITDKKLTEKCVDSHIQTHTHT